MKKFRVIIAGSRDYNNYEKLRNYCDNYLHEHLKNDEVIIISGHTKGADYLGERYAIERGLKFEIFPALWNIHGKKAGMLRNIEMARIADALITFPCIGSENKGTLHMLKTAQKFRLPEITVVDYMYNLFD